MHIPLSEAVYAVSLETLVKVQRVGQLNASIDGKVGKNELNDVPIE